MSDVCPLCGFLLSDEDTICEICGHPPEAENLPDLKNSEIRALQKKAVAKMLSEARKDRLSLRKAHEKMDDYYAFFKKKDEHYGRDPNVIALETILLTIAGGVVGFLIGIYVGLTLV